MDPLLLTDIPLVIDVPALLARLHVPAGTDEAREVEALTAGARAAGRPKAVCGAGYITGRADGGVIVDGIPLTSHVLAVNIEQAHRVFPYVATCGRELDAWSEGFSDPLARYWADAIKVAALVCARQAVIQRVEQEFAPGPTKTMNPGSLEDWPLSQQRQLFAIIGPAAASIGVELTDSCLMVPTKSVSGLQFPTASSWENCQLCPRDNCPGRRAPYDRDLYRRKYASK